MISPETRVLIHNIGYIQVKDAPLGEHLIWNGEGNALATIDKLDPVPMGTIEFLSGKTITASEDQEFLARRFLEKDLWIPLKELKTTNLIYFSDNTYDFDYLDLSKYQTLKWMTSEQVGLLVGLQHCLQVQNGLDIPRRRRETVNEIDNLLKLTGTKWNKEEYFKRTERWRYTLSLQLLDDLKNFSIDEGLPPVFWTSKTLMRGLLKSLFTFGVIRHESFTIRANKNSNLLKEIQEYLGLFGIHCSYSRGFKMSQLIIFKNSCYRFAESIGIFNLKDLFNGVDFRKVLVYKDSMKSDMRYGSFHRLFQIKEQEAFEISCESFMAGGLVLRKI